ncbi:putative MFS monocarboxylate transporter [Aspergillus steynii IBT 23096]|uniref:Putative MFS monocarboxylate transporter n=1 Tax=Aspergillus steynii IBT 23096 TaxID=1392250 RepID=A0A2I2FWJ2_9EURO|nr:putative MFS monocarboxylate transporter [Aspergillus steynii IBT 23096]PLB44998.1 putative MFS monocarboxylate transporter [Aspergillus steynii IBT 23096]
MGKQDDPAVVQKPPSEYTRRAWLVIVGASLGAFCSVGFMNSFGLFEAHYATDQLANESQSTIAWLGAIAIFFIFSVSVISGAIQDVLGPRLPMIIGAVGMVFALMMTSLCKEFYQFLLAQGVLLGISMALLVCPMLGLVGQYIKVKRGLALGIVISGSSLGGVIWPIVINQLLKKPNVGFGWTMRIVGFIMMPLLALCCLWCRPPLETPSPTAHQPNADDSESQEQKADPQKTDYSFLRTPTVILTCVAFFIIYFGMFSPFFYTTSYSLEKGFSDDLSFYTTCIINGASFFGRLIPGILADRYGRFNCCFVATFFSGIIALCWTKATSVAGLVVFSAAYGFSSGGILSLQQACAIQISTPRTIGLTIGVVMASTSLSAMAGVPISGELVAKYGYLSLSIYSGVSLLLGSLLLITARMAQSTKLYAAV